MRNKRSRRPQGDETRHLIEKISDLDLRAWKRFASNVESYNVQLFFHLASLRKLHANEIREALLESKQHTFKKRGWWRIVDFRYSDNPLSPAGSLVKGGRFNYGRDIDPSTFPPFHALYIAEDQQTAYNEKFTVSKNNKSPEFEPHDLALRKPESYSAIRVNLEIENIFDLSSASSLQRFVNIISKFPMPQELKQLGHEIGRHPPWLISTAQDLKDNLLGDDWRLYPMQFDIPSNPQVFGQLLVDAGFDGVLYPSTKARNKKCIAIFSDNLAQSNSFVELADTPHSGVRCSRLDRDSCQSILF